MNESKNPSQDDLRSLLTGQTAKIAWAELAPHFARGNVIRVNKELDLVEVAMSVINDEKKTVENLMNSGKIGNVSSSEAKDWNSQSTELWAVVVAPWILVQEGAAYLN